MNTRTTTITSILFLLSCSCAVMAEASTLASFEARTQLGSSAGQFFDPASGFVDGVDTSHTNTLSFDDGIVQLDITMTVSAFDAGGAAVPLNVTPTAAGVQVLTSQDDRIHEGESIKVTYDDLAFSVIGSSPMGPVDIGSFQALLSTIRLSAFDDGVDTVDYAGVGGAPVVDVNAVGRTATLSLHSNIANGDMFTLTAGTNSNFRALYLSQSGTYRAIPEPATLGLLAVALIGALCSQRNR